LYENNINNNDENTTFSSTKTISGELISSGFMKAKLATTEPPEL
jgi:hypothetical protein